MAEHAGEIVRAELVAGVVSGLHEVVGPLGQQGPVLAGIAGIALGLGERPHEDQHVAAFLDRHLGLDDVQGLVLVPVAIGLAVGERIGAEIVRGEGIRPIRTGAIGEVGIQHGADQRGVEGEEHRGGRVGHIDGCDAAIGEILLGEQQRLAGGACGELVGRDGVTPAQREQRGVSLAGQGRGARGEIRLERDATLANAVALAPGELHHRDRLQPVAPPPRPQPLAEQLDGPFVVIGHDNGAACRPARASPRDRRSAPSPHRRCSRPCAAGSSGLSRTRALSSRRCHGRHRYRRRRRRPRPPGRRGMRYPSRCGGGRPTFPGPAGLGTQGGG